jgi:hypothetical protein
MMDFAPCRVAAAKTQLLCSSGQVALGLTPHPATAVATWQCGSRSPSDLAVHAAALYRRERVWRIVASGIGGTLLVIGIFAVVGALACLAEDWSRFRGPNGAGVSVHTGFPVEFGADVAFKDLLADDVGDPETHGLIHRQTPLPGVGPVRHPEDVLSVRDRHRVRRILHDLGVDPNQALCLHRLPLRQGVWAGRMGRGLPQRRDHTGP